VLRRWAIAGLSALALLPWSLQGARPTTAQRTARKKIPVTTPCGGNASLAISASSVSQGGLLLATVSAGQEIKDVHAKLGSEEVSFWLSSPDAKPPSKTEKWFALVPIDLEKPPGDYVLSVELQPAAAQSEACKIPIRVILGKFATENLHVDNQFVAPNPEQAERAKKEQEHLREIYASVTPQKLWQGKFRVPLDGVTTGSNFGRRRVLNGEARSPHAGVDLPATTGTPVYAAQAGRVVLAEPLFVAGNTVVIDHGLGIYTLYCHLSEIGVHVGDSLKFGQILGKVGATGRVTGPHLHWGLSIYRARVNALQIVNFPL
jgi:murein DD-endopeptidase MepM/ murein hydrolase activator NlpD